METMEENTRQDVVQSKQFDNSINFSDIKSEKKLSKSLPNCILHFSEIPVENNAGISCMLYIEDITTLISFLGKSNLTILPDQF